MNWRCIDLKHCFQLRDLFDLCWKSADASEDFFLFFYHHMSIWLKKKNLRQTGIFKRNRKNAVSRRYPGVSDAYTHTHSLAAGEEDEFHRCTSGRTRCEDAFFFLDRSRFEVIPGQTCASLSGKRTEMINWYQPLSHPTSQRNSRRAGSATSPEQQPIVPPPLRRRTGASSFTTFTTDSRVVRTFCSLYLPH